MKQLSQEVLSRDSCERNNGIGVRPRKRGYAIPNLSFSAYLKHTPGTGFAGDGTGNHPLNRQCAPLPWYKMLKQFHMLNFTEVIEHIDLVLLKGLPGNGLCCDGNCRFCKGFRVPENQNSVALCHDGNVFLWEIKCYPHSADQQLKPFGCAGFSSHLFSQITKIDLSQRTPPTFSL